MPIIRIKARVVPRPCHYSTTCSGACEWCETHSYSEACVPLLQQEVQRLQRTHAGCKHCDGASFTEKPFVVITQRARVELPFRYCPNCGRMLDGAE